MIYPSMSRRHIVRAGLATALGTRIGWAPSETALAAVPQDAPRSLQFPRDLGSHPQAAIEWWYVTGALQAGPQRFGFQLTFFRSRVPSTQAMRSALAAKQLFFAHAAVTDVANQRLLHDQRIARGTSQGTDPADLTHASDRDTHVAMGNWSLVRDGATYLAAASTADFSLTLQLQQTQPLLLQGHAGWSQKGPQVTQGSHYYSLPQLQVSGELRIRRQPVAVLGRAWLDHEWSQSILPPGAVGWDWIGMNLLDGSALTAFRLRDAAGQSIWAGGSWRGSGGAGPVETFSAQQVRFTPLRHWTSNATRTRYPVAWQVTAGNRHFVVRAVIDNQELDSRGSTGAVYWEGLSELLDDQDRLVGHGYLEMTGYVGPLNL